MELKDVRIKFSFIEICSTVGITPIHVRIIKAQNNNLSLHILIRPLKQISYILKMKNLTQII